MPQEHPIHRRPCPNSPFPSLSRPLLALLVLAAVAATGCSSVRAPGLSPVPCSRVGLEAAPPWTASAAWDQDEDEMLLVDPDTHSLVTYGRDGQRRREVDLDAVAEINYSVPMRLQRVEDGYLLIDQTQVLHLDDELRLRRRENPFAGLENAQGVLGASLNDVLVADDGTLQGYADYLDTRVIPEDDPKAMGTWRRGFMRLDLRLDLRPDDTGRRLDLVHEVPITQGGEYESYYLYGGRPYVTEVDGKVYVRRYTSPWSIHRLTRKGLRPVVSGDADDAARAVSIHGWNGRLYVLLRTTVADESAPAQPTVPQLNSDTGRFHVDRAELARQERTTWEVAEIDPRKGRILRRVALPSTARGIHLVTGSTFWTAVEQASELNLGREGDGMSFLFLPARELVEGQFSCADGGGVKPGP